jgi:hypothetical protein
LAILLREWNYFRIFAAQFINQKLYDNEKDYARGRLDLHRHVPDGESGMMAD